MVESIFRYRLFSTPFLNVNTNYYQDKTYNIQAPFASPLIIDLIRTQWFEGGRADHAAFHAMVEQKKIPAETVILCFSCVRYVTSFLVTTDTLFVD